MDHSLKTLCHAIKKLLGQLKPQQHPLSFTLLTGKNHQGNTALLQQSQLQPLLVNDQHPPTLYYNPHGIVLDLGEKALQADQHPLQHTLKQLNHCYPGLKISGLMVCIDMEELCVLDPDLLVENYKTHATWIERFNKNLPPKTPLALVFTKMDHLAGFGEFFQQEHESDLKKPLGFSFHRSPGLEDYTQQFNQFIESIGQNMATKIHAVRSSIKRTLIREFPLQLASLGPNIQRLLSRLPASCHVQTIYFTSAEQGGIIIDRLHDKIQDEYFLSCHDKLPHATNYRSYFIEGAVRSFQNDTQQLPTRLKPSSRRRIGAILLVTGFMIALIVHHTIHTYKVLDETGQHLAAYTQLSQQNHKTGAANYRLTKAAMALQRLTAHHLVVPSSIQSLGQQLHHLQRQHLQTDTLPELLKELEQTITDAQSSHHDRYLALKTYLLFNHNSPGREEQIIAWYKQHAKKSTPITEKKITLLHQLLHPSNHKIPLNKVIIQDARNYLNALPPEYLYYSLAKQYLPNTTVPITIEGFNLANNRIPVYFTKPGFLRTMTQLTSIAQQLQNDNWILARQDLNHLPRLLEKAYCADYVSWWQQWMRKTKPKPVRSYADALDLSQQLYDTQAFEHLAQLMAAHTSPASGKYADVFNRTIASQFTRLSLMSQSSIKTLAETLLELRQFLKTMGMVHDHGKTAFLFTKSRFQGDDFDNPLNTLYHQAARLPEPIGAWTKQLADDLWFILIQDSREHINRQWQHTVYAMYQKNIEHRFPLDVHAEQDLLLNDFNAFFAPHGVFKEFFNTYLVAFLDTSNPQWQLKNKDGYVLPMSPELVNELIRANVITSMFFPNDRSTSQIDFSLQKLSLDPVVSKLSLTLGETTLNDTQSSDSLTTFHWPASDAKLIIHSIEGNQYALEETGPWAFFKLLQKVNVLVDEENSAHLQILFEINGNSGRYLLKTDNEVNPFIPGILNGLILSRDILPSN